MAAVVWMRRREGRWWLLTESGGRFLDVKGRHEWVSYSILNLSVDTYIYHLCHILFWLFNMLFGFLISLSTIRACLSQAAENDGNFSSQSPYTSITR